MTHRQHRRLTTRCDLNAQPYALIDEACSGSARTWHGRFVMC